MNDTAAPAEGDLRELVGRVADDARAYAEAEVAVAREVVAVRARSARSGVMMLIAGLSLAIAASVALVLGILLTVSQAVGPLLATLIVVTATIAIGGGLAWVGWGRVKQAFKGKL